jgi:hypothetical protein
MPMAYADATGFFGGAATMSPYGTVMAPPYAAAYAMAPSAASPPPKVSPSPHAHAPPHTHTAHAHTDVCLLVYVVVFRESR